MFQLDDFIIDEILSLEDEQHLRRTGHPTERGNSQAVSYYNYFMVMLQYLSVQHTLSHITFSYLCYMLLVLYLLLNFTSQKYLTVLLS